MEWLLNITQEHTLYKWAGQASGQKQSALPEK